MVEGLKTLRPLKSSGRQGIFPRKGILSILDSLAIAVQMLTKIMRTPGKVLGDLNTNITDQLLNESYQKRMWDPYLAKLNNKDYE